MLKFSLVPLSLCLAVSAAAQVRVAPLGSPWSASVSRALTAAGPEGLARTGSLSLPRLFEPGPGGTPLALERPELLAPLAQTLQWREVSPARLAAERPEAALEILAQSALLTEERVARTIMTLETVTRGEMSLARRVEVDALLRDAPTLETYAAPEGAALVERLRERARAFDRTREAAHAAFLKDLPDRLAAGVFDGGSRILPEPGDGGRGWRLEDSHPASYEETPLAALSVRIGLAERSPAGHWQAAEARFYRAALHRAVAEGLIDGGEDAVTLERRLTRLEKESLLIDRPALAKSLARVRAGDFDFEDLRRTLQHYRYALHAAPDWRARARIISTLRVDTPEAPSWRLLRASAEEAVEIADGYAYTGRFSAVLAVLAALMSAGLGAHWAFAALIGAIALSTTIYAAKWTIRAWGISKTLQEHEHPEYKRI